MIVRMHLTLLGITLRVLLPLRPTGPLPCALPVINLVTAPLIAQSPYLGGSHLPQTAHNLHGTIVDMPLPTEVV